MYYITGNIKTKKVKIGVDGELGQILLPEHSLKVAKYAKDFVWGVEGDAPLQLSLAILLSATTEEDAKKLAQSFRDEVMVKWPSRNFTYRLTMNKWLKAKGSKYVANNTDFKPYVPEEDGPVGRACGDICTQSKTKECNCACGGKMHGTAQKDAVPSKPKIEAKKA